MTFANAPKLRDALKVTPADRVLVETDAPFLTPVPHRGQPNASFLIPYTLQSMAKTRGDDLADLCAQIEANTALVEAQGKRAHLATRRYEEGVDGYFEVLNALLDHYAARQKLVQLRMSRAINSVTLYKALGGGW